MNKYPEDFELFTEYSEKVENYIRRLKQEIENIKKELFLLRAMKRTWLDKQEAETKTTTGGC